MNADPSDTNRFKIANPDDWYCKVLSYPYALTNMKIEVRHPNDEVLFLEFRNIIYFSGWLSWKGVNFRVAEDNEYIQFVHTTTSGYTKFTNTELLKPGMLGIFRLFVCQGDGDTNIRIIANAAWSFDSSGQLLAEVW